MNAIVFLWKLVNGKNRTPLNDIVSSLGVTSLISSNFLSLAMLGPLIAMRLQFFGETFFWSLSAFQFSQWAQEPPHRPNEISLHSSFEKWESIKNSIHHLFKWLNKLNATLKTNHFNEFKIWRSHTITLFSATLKMNVNEWSHFKLYDYLFHSIWNFYWFNFPLK